MADDCSKCEDFAAQGSLFCGECGKPIAEQKPKASDNKILSTVILISCIFVLFILVFEMITLLAHVPDVFDLLSDKRMGIIVIVPLPYVVFYISGLALQIYWLIIVSIITACAVYAIYKFIVAPKGREGIVGPDVFENTAGFWITLSLCVTLFLNFAILFVLAIFGNEINTPSFGDELEQMFLLAEASFWEEVISRLFYIGVPITIVSLIITKKKDSLKCLFGGFGMSMSAIILIIISGAIFGLAHYPGWGEAWKVLGAGIMGMFLGYVFVRFGLYASILLHFINNYLSSFSWMDGGGFFTLANLFLIAVGAISLYYIIARISESVGSIDSLPMFSNRYSKQN